MNSLPPRRNKQDIRAHIRSRRHGLSEVQRSQRDSLVEEQVLGLSQHIPPSAIVSCYEPRNSEPGTNSMVATLAARGFHVIVPVVTGKEAPLQWRTWDQSESLYPAEFLVQASLIILPALAVGYDGVRLGQGGGHYDRSLCFADPQALLLAVIDGQELFDEGDLPQEDHDHRVDGAITPAEIILFDKYKAAALFPEHHPGRS